MIEALESGNGQRFVQSKSRSVALLGYRSQLTNPSMRCGPQPIWRRKSLIGGSPILTPSKFNDVFCPATVCISCNTSYRLVPCKGYHLTKDDHSNNESALLLWLEACHRAINSHDMRQVLNDSD